jgi:hypothetical protein
MKPGNIELYVDELVLYGFSPADRHRLGEAVEQELGRLLTTQGAPRSLAQHGEIPRLDGGSFEVKPGYGVAAIGSQVAQAVYGGLSA